MALSEGERLVSLVWIVDSGCSNHITGLKGFFIELDESLKLKFRLGITRRLQWKGEAQLPSVQGEGHVKLLRDV